MGAERYEIVEKLGEGGFAHVYLARDQMTGRKVALKILKESERYDREVVERFGREAFAISSIQSPHVVALYDFELTGNEHYLALELVEGPTLRDIIKTRQWTLEDVHRLIGQAAQALAAAHRRNIIHRDLKPENIKLSKDPSGKGEVVKVLDFGFAKLAEFERDIGGRELTRVGACFGTPQYMAPEQIHGKPPTESVDLYALAVITYELLAGRRPWGGKDAYDVMLNVIRTPAPPLEEVLGKPQRLDEVNAFFKRALAKDRDLRPASAAELFQELEMALFGAARARATASGVSDEDAPFASVLNSALEPASNGSDTMRVGADQIAEMARRAAEHERSDDKEKLSSGWFDTKQLDEAVEGALARMIKPPSDKPPAEASPPSADEPAPPSSAAGTPTPPSARAAALDEPTLAPKTQPAPSSGGMRTLAYVVIIALIAVAAFFAGRMMR